MATYYFMGGEDHDFTKFGVCSVDTNTAFRRSANTRCSLLVGSSNGATDGWGGALSSPQSTLWLTARVFASQVSASTACDLVSFSDSGAVRRLAVRTNGSSTVLTIAKRNAAGTYTTLATSSYTLPLGAVQKIDVAVTYGTSGKVDVYIEGTLVATYSGDITTDGNTALSSFTVGCAAIGGSSGTYWSEVICSDSDTRDLSLVTMAPTANGNTFGWDAGSVTSINETTLNDTTVITSGTTGQLAQFTVGSSGITGNNAIKAVCISARAVKGGTGPQNIRMNVRTGGTNSNSAAIALPAALGRIQNVFATNPVTASNWVGTDLTAAGFNIGVQSET